MEGTMPRTAALAPCHTLNIASSSCRWRRRTKKSSISLPAALLEDLREPLRPSISRTDEELEARVGPLQPTLGVLGAGDDAKPEATEPGVLGAGDEAQAEAAEDGRGVLGVCPPLATCGRLPTDGVDDDAARWPNERRSFTIRRCRCRWLQASPQASADTWRAKKP
mmetsp:Transcript_70738/g.207183  ORF Transcript_70738/g.207183 Transcript_70738/m.207183 type:complete len:166 (-) Transcript_70738:308-805(-)